MTTGSKDRSTFINAMKVVVNGVLWKIIKKKNEK